MKRLQTLRAHPTDGPCVLVVVRLNQQVQILADLAHIVLVDADRPEQVDRVGRVIVAKAAGFFRRRRHGRRKQL